MADIIGDKIIFEEVPCWSCNGTKVTDRGILCPEWNNKVRGRLGGHCPHCGATNRWQHRVVGNETIECYYCSGTGKIMENSNSHITKNVYSRLIYKVYRENSVRVDEDIVSKNRYGGEGKNIGGCTDYGVSVNKTDEEVIGGVGQTHRLSYLQIMDDNNMLCREISIIVGKYGYMMKAIF